MDGAVVPTVVAQDLHLSVLGPITLVPSITRLEIVEGPQAVKHGP